MSDGIRKFYINWKQVKLPKDKKSVSKDLYAQDTKLNTIFNKLNKADENGNVDDILDENEIKDFQQKIIDAAGEDGDLSTQEAKTLLDSMGLKDIDTNKFFSFIHSMFSKDETDDVGNGETEQPKEEAEEGGDEQITKGIIVQNGESPAAIAKKFGVPLKELIEANKDILKGKGNNKYFLVGQEIIIPRKIDNEELETLNVGRKSAEETRGDYAQQAAIRQQKAAEARERRAQEEATLKELGMTERANDEVKAHYAKTPNKTVTFKKVANAKNGRSICVDKNENYVVVAQDGTILKTDYVKNPEKYEQARKYNANVKTRKNAENLAQQFYQIADDNSGLNSMKKMQELLDNKINSKNIVAFLDAYDREKTKQGDSSIIDTVTSEVGAGGTKQQRQVLMSIMDKLCAAAKEAGVSAGDIQKARQDFEASLNKEFNAAFRRTNPKDMEKAVDFLRGAIASKANGGGQISEKDAIRQFNSTFGAENATAQKDYKDARANEGWTAKVGDTVCGWFGCNTIADMDKKLGANAAAVKKLANSKTEAEFKKNYKEVFGIDFDKNKIAARQTAIDKYNLAQNCNSTIKLTDKVLKFAGSYSDLKTALKNNFKYDEATINQIIDNYAIQTGKNAPTDEEKKELLVKFLQDTKANTSQNLRTATNGKTIEQMGKDIDLITRSAFGTNDIVKDVIQFNENQQTTEMITEAAFEIGGTIALQFVPGLGQMAAARLAVSAARWGTKAVKVVNYATKAEKAFATVNKFQKGQVISKATTRSAKVVNKGVQVASQMVNTGIATAGVDLSNGKSVKEATQKALMNMSFAGVGASSSILAPKLMSAFGIADKALATEIAEEIINAAGSYGITKLEGGEYGSTDAFVDFASGLIMARISHVGGSKPTIKPQEATTPTTPKVDIPPSKVETPITPVVNTKPTPEIETPVTPQPKYTKEFEPAYNDTPVSPEIIDERLRPNNPELKDMADYYRELETREFEPHYEKREVSAKTIDEQFNTENPELKKLNEEFASGNSMLQKQVAVENAIENLSYQNYSPEYVENIRAKIKEISVDNPEMEKSYNELLDLAAHDASVERANLIREKEYIERTYGTHKSAQESAEVFSDHFEQVNAAKEDDYIRRTYQNPSGKSAAESAQVIEQQMAIREQVNAVDEQLHKRTLLDGDELFERITHSDNPELQKLGAQYKKLEAQEAELKQQVEKLKEQIRRKSQTSASEIDGRFSRSNPELDLMNAKYRSLEWQQEQLKKQVEKLKQQMREKISVSADDIDARLNQRTGDYEDLASDLRNREAIGQRAKKELEIERAEQAAVEREQAYIDRTHGTTHKSASESADVFKADFDQKEAAAKAKITIEQAKLQCSDEKLIELATTKDGMVHKDALDLAIQYKKLADCDYNNVEFLLEQCNGNYKKVSELMDKIQSELEKLDLEIRHGEIGIKGLKIGEYPDMDIREFVKKYDMNMDIFNKLRNGCYRIDNLMNFYLFGKGRYMELFQSGNIMKDFDVAYGCRSVTDLYQVRYTNIGEKEGEIAELMAHSLSSIPTPDQRRALGCYKGDMSDSIQERRMIEEGNDIEEYLSKNPLKKTIKVKREDSYEILSNLKFPDGVTLQDAIKNPQYHDRLAQIKSLEGQSFINDRFMSTTVGNGAFGNSNVNWDLEVAEGVGATYLDILGLASEGELLLNRGLKITIVEIEDTTPNGIVNIKAKVEKVS